MFKPLLSPKFILIFPAILFFAVITFAQDGPPPMQEERARNDDRPNLLAQLGLTPEQVQQFRRLNAEHRPVMNEAQKRMRDATRELDVAIYADVVSDDVVREKLRAFQEAQANLNSLMFGNELAIRKILTLEQLVRFRDMRRRMGEARQQNKRQNGRPLNSRPRRDMIPAQNPPNVQRPADNQKRPIN